MSEILKPEKEAPRSRRFAQMKRPPWVRNAWFGTRYFLGSHGPTFPALHLAPAPYSRRIRARKVPTAQPTSST